MKGFAKQIVLFILRVLNNVISKKNIISLSSNPDFSDSPQALYYYFIEKELFKDNIFVWHIQKKDNIPYVKEWVQLISEHSSSKTVIVRKYSIKSVLYFLQSKTILSSHGLYSFKSKRQTEIYLWHGMPLKKGGYLNIKDIRFGVDTADYYTATSSVFVEPLMGQFHANSNQIKVVGLPRNDYLFHPVKNPFFDEPFILFMPTYRKTNSTFSYFREDCTSKSDKLFNILKSEWSMIDGILEKKNTKLIIKPHPLDLLENIDYISKLKNVLLINDDILLRNRIPLYSFIASSDALISDYSSVTLDYTLTDKPLAYFIPDFHEYENNRGFVFDNIEEKMAGKICVNCNDLIDFINKQEKSERYYYLKRVFNEILDDTSCSKVADTFKKYF